MNILRIDNYWFLYKKEYSLGTDNSKNEIYKWQIFQQLFNYWNWKVEDKKKMITNAFNVRGSNNLWASGNYFPIRMLEIILNDFPDETIQAFEILFDQRVDLLERISSFKKTFDELLIKLQNKYPEREKMNSHYQDVRIISIYLMLQFPEEFVFYKYNVAKDLFKIINRDGIKKGDDQSFIEFNNLAREIKSYIKQDIEYLNQYKHYLEKNSLYKDTYLDILTQDFIFTIVNYLAVNNDDFSISKDLTKILIHQKNYIYDYFDIMDELVDQLDLEPNSDKYYFNYEKNSNKLIFTIGQRYIWRIENEGYKYITNNKSENVIYDFSGLPEAFTINVSFIDNKTNMLNEIVNAGKLELNRTSNSSFKKYNKKDLQELVFNKEFRAKILKTLNISNNQSKIKTSKPMQYIPLNQILYGPPGTGKTYNTINKAIEIANSEFDLNQDRNTIKQEYNRLVDEGQIVFTTFHQSMTYEDFIEGIKPETKDNNVIYNIKNGIFKEIANKSLDNWQNSLFSTKQSKPFDKVFQLLKDEWEENPMLEFPMKREGNDFKILGFSDSSISFLKASGTNNHTLSINTLRDLYYGKREFKNQGVGIYYPSIVDKLKSYDIDFEKESVTNEKKNFVIIIDEINRGNVSQIFGELITLIEEDKRLGNDEALEITLPYSKEKFGVPSNLHIIGTMNTADRSVEALDTALRRRFVFEEMPPKYELEGLQQELYGFKAAEILKTINKRIEKLLDRDHLIGHAYFINKDETTIIDSFYKNIIPLLQEYFFADYGKIGLVLGSGFIKIIENESIFASFDYENAQDFDDKKSFKILGINDKDFNFENAIKLLMNQ